MENNKEIQDLEWIEGYMEGTLNAKSLELFEVRRKEDAAFDTTVQEMDTLIKGIRYAERKLMEDKLRLWESGMSESKDKRGWLVPLYRNKVFMVAASFALVAVFTALFYQFRPTSSEELFSEYYEPLLMSGVVTRGIQDDKADLSPKKLAQIDYNNDDFTSAIEKFEALPREQLVSEDFVYMGIACMESSKVDKALDYFDAVTPENGMIYYRAQWYKGLAYLKVDKKNEAKAIFMSLVESDSSYREKAEEILRNF